ncbi:MAG: hypothetical protein RQ894_01635 [Candidatus Pacebacteria bacterium]|jgi:hypothetical protein|nr:hypothetical protein [Candidatus Paceibacterota bacterium]
MIEGRKEKPLRREEGEKERNIEFSHWGEILTYAFKAFVRIKERVKNIIENIINPPYDHDPERRKVLKYLLALLAAAYFAGCQTEESSPNLPQQPLPQPQRIENPFNPHPAYERFVNEWSTPETKPYVWSDQIVFTYDENNGLTVFKGSLNEFLEELSQRGLGGNIELGKQEIILKIPPNTNDNAIKTLESFLNLPIDSKYTLRLQEVKIGGNSYYIPSAWMDKVKLSQKGLVSIEVNLTQQKAKNLLESFAKVINRYNLGIEVNKDELSEKVKQRIQERNLTIDGNLKTSRGFIHASDLNAGKNLDLALLQEWANDPNIKKIVLVELRTNTEGIVTRNQGRFMLIAFDQNGETVGMFVLPDNYHGSIVVKRAINLVDEPNAKPQDQATQEEINRRRKVMHLRLRHSRDFPPRLAEEMVEIGSEINDHLLGKLRTEELFEKGYSFNVRGQYQVEVLEKTPVTGGFRVRTIVKIGERSVSFELLLEEKGRFGTFYPLGGVKEGGTLSVKKFEELDRINTELSRRPLEQIVKDPSVVSDPFLQSFLFAYSWGVIAHKTEELSGYKESIISYLKGEEQIKNLIKDHRHLILIPKNNEGLGLEIFVHRGDVYLEDSEFGYFMQSDLFTIDPREIGLEGNGITHINFGVIRHFDEFKRDIINQGVFEKKEIDDYFVYIPK